MVYQNPTHGLCRNSKEVGPILPSHSLVIYEPKVDLINQIRGLKCVTGTLTAHVMMGQPMKFVVDERNKPIKRAFVPSAPFDEQLGY
jgi:hypothetical protein